MAADPCIIYVPGMRPKPEPEVHREALLRCILEGVRRKDAAVAASIEANSDAFQIVSWTFAFYNQHRDIALDLPAIEGVLQQQDATVQDIVDAHALKRRLLRALYRAADNLPFLIPHFANEKMELHLRDLRRYVSNTNDVAELTRLMLKNPLLRAAEAGRPILLLAHSMGTVIAWETLWQLSRMSADDVPVDLLVTMGSPLGQRYIQKRLLGHTIENERRYPDNIRRWVNISAVGELTALDYELANDFAPMLRDGVVEEIRDLSIYNYYREDGQLNAHAEYGYLVNKATASTICDWWRSYCE
ncbi:MAG: hypothetical protein KJO31_02270 [Gammaproteobacteria bacterium]|nr:hypothetical protein [Gammaproteobacteria bacterium]